MHYEMGQRHGAMRLANKTSFNPTESLTKPMNLYGSQL